MFLRRIWWVTLLAVLGCTDAASVGVENARVMAPLPGKTVSSGYFDLHNPTTETLVLIGVSSPNARAMEIHRSFEVDGRMRMQRQKQVTIEPGQTTAFAPGGLHLMLFGVEALPEQVPITLRFESHPDLQATFALAHW